MGSSLTRYFPGGAETQVDARPIRVPQLAMPSIGGGAIGGSGMPDFNGVLAQGAKIEAEREARAAAMQRLQMAAMRQQMGAAASDQRFGENERFNAGLANQAEQGFRGNVQDLQLQAMRADEQAKGPQPLKMMTGFNMIPGYMPDTIKMDARQRQNYLPDHSANAPDRDAEAGYIRAKTAEGDFDGPFNAGRRRDFAWRIGEGAAGADGRGGRR